MATSCLACLPFQFRWGRVGEKQAEREREREQANVKTIKPLHQSCLCLEWKWPFFSLQMANRYAWSQNEEATLIPYKPLDRWARHNTIQAPGGVSICTSISVPVYFHLFPFLLPFSCFPSFSSPPHPTEPRWMLTEPMCYRQHGALIPLPRVPVQVDSRSTEECE